MRILKWNHASIGHDDMLLGSYSLRTSVWLIDIAEAVYWWDLEMTSIATKDTKWRATSGNHTVNSETKLSLITEKFVLWE